MNSFLKHYGKNNYISKRIQKSIHSFHVMDDVRLLELYNSVFIDLFKGAYHHSKFYNRLYASHGISKNDIKDITDLKKLPLIYRKDIKNEIDKIYHGNPFSKIKGFTSGTSGSPLTVYRSPLSINTESAYIRYFRAIHGFKPGDPLVSIRGTLNKNSLFRFCKISNVLYLSSPNINSYNIDLFHSLISRFKPKAIEAFPSYLFKLQLELSKKRLSAEFPLAFTSSEMLYDFQRDQIESYLKTKIFDWYGNVERTIGLVQYNYKEYKPLPLYSINEYSDDHVITTSLNNFRFPLIRYVVDDKIEVKGKNFIQNVISPEIVNINGRSGDTIELKDGSQVSCIDHAFKGINHLEMAQIHQNDVINPLLIKLVVEPEFSNNDEEALKRNLKNMIGQNMQIIFKYCNKEELIRNNQKYRLIVKKNS